MFKPPRYAPFRQEGPLLPERARSPHLAHMPLLPCAPAALLSARLHTHPVPVHLGTTFLRTVSTQGQGPMLGSPWASPQQHLALPLELPKGAEGR